MEYNMYHFVAHLQLPTFLTDKSVHTFCYSKSDYC